MLEKHIFSQNVLDPLNAEVIRRVGGIEVSSEIDPRDPTYGTAFANYLLFTHWPNLLGLSPEDSRVFYNRYYYFKQFAQLFQSRHGRDVGLDQQAFQLLETAGDRIDWNVFEAIDLSLASGAGGTRSTKSDGKN